MSCRQGRRPGIQKTDITDITLDSLLAPQNFDMVVEIAKEMSTEKSVNRPLIGECLSGKVLCCTPERGSDREGSGDLFQEADRKRMEQPCKPRGYAAYKQRESNENACSSFDGRPAGI